MMKTGLILSRIEPDGECLLLPFSCKSLDFSTSICIFLAIYSSVHVSVTSTGLHMLQMEHDTDVIYIFYLSVGYFRIQSLPLLICAVRRFHHPPYSCYYR